MIHTLADNKIKKLQVFLCFLLQHIIVDAIEIWGVIPIYYPEHTFRFDIGGLLLSVVILGVYAWMTPTDKEKPSTWAYLLLVLALGVPSTSVYWVMRRSVEYLWIVLGFIALVSFVLHLDIRLRVVRITHADGLIWFLFALYVVGSIYLFIKRGGIDSRAFDFSTIYDLREEDNISGFAGYLKNWCVKMLFPFFMLYFFEKKRYILSGTCIVLQLLLYLSFGEKTTLFSLALVCGVYYVYRFKKYRFLFVAFSIVVLIPLLIYVFTDDYGWLASLSRRFCHVPSAIGYNYYDFFSQGNPHLWLCETMFGRMFNMQSPYPRTFSYYISGGQGMANTGVIADAYANGGLLFCFLFALLLGLFFVLYDEILKNRKHKAVIVGVLGYSCINLMDNGLLTTLLTNGMLITLIFAMILPAEESTPSLGSCETPLHRFKEKRK